MRVRMDQYIYFRFVVRVSHTGSTFIKHAIKNFVNGAFSFCKREIPIDEVILRTSLTGSKTWHTWPGSVGDSPDYGV